MTRRDYVLIADVLKELGEDAAQCFDDPCDRVRIAMKFAERLGNDNPRFDTDRFMTAATLEGDIEEAAEAAELNG